MHWSLTTRYKILLEINNAVITNFSLNEFYKALSAELRRHFDYDRLSIFIYDQKSRSLTYLRIADGVQPEGFEKKIRPLSGATVARMVIESKKPVVIKDLSAYSDQPAIPAMIKAGLTSTLAFPLIVRNNILGTLHMSFKKIPDDLPGLTRILNDISSQVAIAVGNMVTFSKLVEEKHHLERENNFLLNANGEYQVNNFLYISPKMVDIMKFAQKVAEIDAPLLITGETGTGKDYIARYIHSISPRRDHLFVKVNCPALTSSLFESELFGHVKGAFTGADINRTGRFEMADKGVIFLDEIAELPPGLQAKLLQVLQEHQFERVGDNQLVKTNFRLIAATNKNLFDLINQGKFRKDLYYRLNTLQVQVPPLRERIDDIPYLIKEINKMVSAELNRPAPRYSEKVIRFLTAYHWPGNVRELKNIVKRFAILKPGEIISLSDIQNLVDMTRRPDTSPENNIPALAPYEQTGIERALIKSHGVVGGPKGAAQILGLPKSTLQYRIKKFGFNPKDYA